MKKLYFLSIFSTIFIALIAVNLFYTTNALAENSFSFPDNGSKNGLQEIVLNAGGGKIKVNLPADIRPGDTISGTVFAEPTGKTDAERSTNSGQLSGYVVEIAGAKQTEWKKVGNKLSATIKFALTDGKTTSVLLKSKTGAVISSVPMAIQSVSMTMPPTSPPIANDFKLPTIGQQGRQSSIYRAQGSVIEDASFDDTTIRVGNKPAEVLASSPREIIFTSPTNVSGPTQITLKKGNVEKTGAFRNLGVDLTSPKTSLMKGEKTTVNVAVSGLDGITSPVPMQVVTTGAVNMTGGNTQNIQIAPNQVGSGGTYTQTFGLTAVQAGGFNVTATVLADQDADQQEQAKCKCTCELNTPPILAGRTGKGSYEASVKTAKCEGKREDNCKVSTTTFSWSVVAADSTAEYKVNDTTKGSSKFEVEITKSGKLTVSVTATVTCSDGTKCTATGSKTFDVKK